MLKSNINHPGTSTSIPAPTESLLYSVYADAEANQSTTSISSTATADSLDGLGRSLGSLYTSLGRRLEDVLNRFMVRVGYGPDACRRRIMRKRRAVALLGNLGCEWNYSGSSMRHGSGPRSEGIPFPYTREDTRFRKELQKLLKYVSSEVPVNRALALDAILTLAISDPYLRALFITLGAPRILASEIVRTLRSPDLDAELEWENAHLLAPAQKALVCLFEVEINSAGQRAGLLYRSIWNNMRQLPEDSNALSFKWEDLSAFLDTVDELIRHAVQSPALSFLALRHLCAAPLFTGFESLFHSHSPDQLSTCTHPSLLRVRAQYALVPFALGRAFLRLLAHPDVHDWIEWQSFGWLLCVFALYSRGITERMELARKITSHSWVHLPAHIKTNLADFDPNATTDSAQDRSDFGPD